MKEFIKDQKNFYSYDDSIPDEIRYLRNKEEIFDTLETIFYD